MLERSEASCEENREDDETVGYGARWKRTWKNTETEKGTKGVRGTA